MTGLDENLYANNTESYLYTPMFDLGEYGLYELKFWTKYALQNRNDGFQVSILSMRALHGSNWVQAVIRIGTTITIPICQMQRSRSEKIISQMHSSTGGNM